MIFSLCLVSVRVRRYYFLECCVLRFLWLFFSFLWFSVSFKDFSGFQTFWGKFWASVRPSGPIYNGEIDGNMGHFPTASLQHSPLSLVYDVLRLVVRNGGTIRSRNHRISVFSVDLIKVLYWWTFWNIEICRLGRKRAVSHALFVDENVYQLKLGNCFFVLTLLFYTIFFLFFITFLTTLLQFFALKVNRSLLL